MNTEQTPEKDRLMTTDNTSPQGSHEPHLDTTPGDVAPAQKEAGIDNAVHGTDETVNGVDNTTKGTDNTAKDIDNIDEIMASIMESISRDMPSPVDSVHTTLVEQAAPLDYDIYRYDDKPAVVLGAGVATSGAAAYRTDTPFKGAVPSTDEIEPDTHPKNVRKHEVSSQGVERRTIEVPELPSESERMERLASRPEITAEITGLDTQNPSVTSVMEALPSTPYIPQKVSDNPDDFYKVQFDFGDRNASKWLTVFPYMIHFILGLALGAGILRYFALNGHPVSPIASDHFIYTLYGLAGIVILGILIGLIFGILARIQTRGEKKGRISSGLARAGFTTLISVIVWAAAMFVADAIATGKITL